MTYRTNAPSTSKISPGSTVQSTTSSGNRALDSLQDSLSTFFTPSGGGRRRSKGSVSHEKMSPNFDGVDTRRKSADKGATSSMRRSNALLKAAIDTKRRASGVVCFVYFGIAHIDVNKMPSAEDEFENA